jgi:hypothetical protein
VSPAHKKSDQKSDLETLLGTPEEYRRWMRQFENDPLCRLFGISFVPGTKTPENQFTVMARIPGTDLYLLQFREWLLGEPSTIQLRAVSWFVEHDVEWFQTPDEWQDRGGKLLKAADFDRGRVTFVRSAPDSHESDTADSRGTSAHPLPDLPPSPG